VRDTSEQFVERLVKLTGEQLNDRLAQIPTSERIEERLVWVISEQFMERLVIPPASS
jgi:hypothetical protein